MSDVDKLFVDYTQQYRELGSADADAYLNRLEGAPRRELAALIDAYLARQPRRQVDIDAAADPHAHAVADAVHRSFHGRAGMWPVILPQLRRQSELGDSEVGARLAAELGVSNRAEKVEHYYREMERGELGAGEVSDRVLEALARIFKTSDNELRQAGGPFDAAGSPPDARRDTAERQGVWDPVDELFRGGAGRRPRGDPD
jgi:hypothetical protein